MIGVFFYAPEYQRQHELPEQSKPLPAEQKWQKEECMSSERVKKELYETAMTGEKALTSLMYVQMTLYAANSQKTYARVRSEGRARMRHTGLHMNQYLRAAGKDLESFRNRLKETHLPEELQSKAETFLVQTVHVLDVTEKKQMYRGELIGLEEKVKEIAEQIEELLKSMRELGV